MGLGWLACGLTRSRSLLLLVWGLPRPGGDGQRGQLCQTAGQLETRRLRGPEAVTFLLVKLIPTFWLHLFHHVPAPLVLLNLGNQITQGLPMTPDSRWCRNLASPQYYRVTSSLQPSRLRIHKPLTHTAFLARGLTSAGTGFTAGSGTAELVGGCGFCSCWRPELGCGSGADGLGCELRWDKKYMICQTRRALEGIVAQPGTPTVKIMIKKIMLLNQRKVWELKVWGGLIIPRP